MTGALDPDDGGQQLLLGKMLLERGLITPDQLREALVERARSVADGDKQATPLGGILVKKGYLSDSQLLGLIAEQNGAVPPPEFQAPHHRPQEAPAPRSHSRGFDTSSVRPQTRSSISIPSRMPEADPLETDGRLGKYELVRELGRGGMGVVYEAVDSQLNRKVALKLMLANPNADPKDRVVEEERFVQEAQLSAKLKHANIVTVYEAGLMEGRQFLAMEMIDGAPFNDWRRTATLREQIGVIRDVAQAVHHAHEQGILHRDIKPRNILVAGNHPFVTDFGLAKSLGKNVHSSLTGSGAVVGTPAYMSPEQAQGLDRVDWRTDIYSLGVILYECMTGRTPFIGESPIEILMKVVKDPVVPPLQIVDSSHGMGLDKNIENICLKAIAKKDRDRYVTAQAFADDLAKWLAGEQVRVVVPRTKSPHRRVYALTVVLFLVLIGGLAFLWFTFGGAPSVTDDLEAARRAMTDGKYQDAMIHYRIALAKRADHPEALAGVKAVQEALAIKAKEEDEKLQRMLDAKFQEAERLRQEALDKKRREEELSGADREKAAQEAREAEEKAQQAEAEANRLAEQNRRAPTIIVPGTPDDDWRRSQNLLPLVDPHRNAVGGAWDFKDGKLLSDRSANARVEIPFTLPQEYDFRTVFERRTGSGGMSVILSKNGQQFRLELGGDQNTRAAFEVARFSKAIETPEVVRAPVFIRNDRPYMLIVQVRHDGIKTTLDGKPLLEWKTDYKDVGLNPDWKLRNTLRLGVGSERSQTAFHRLDLLQVTGTGRRAVPSNPPPLKALQAVPPGLKAGLLGEYHRGTQLESLALRRVDTMVDFQWSEGPAWTGGPSDSFSVRWSGYLHVPRTSRYVFIVTADDGLRLFIDDIQVMSSWNSPNDLPRMAECALAEGYHRFRAEYHDTGWLASVNLSWAPSPGQAISTIPPKSFFHSPTESLFVAPIAPEVAGELKGHTNNVTSVAFGRSSRILASAGEDRRVRIWDPGAGKDLGMPAVHTQGIPISVAINPLANTFATGARDHKVRIWDLQNRAELQTLEGHTAFVQCVAFDPTGKLLASGSNDHTVRIWDVDQGGELYVLSDHRGGIESVAFSPDGKLLLSASIDQTVRIWEVQTGQQLRLLDGHADSVQAAVFSPSGKTIATAGLDGLIRTWDTESGQGLLVFGGLPVDIMCLAYSPDGKLLVSGDSDGMIRVWDPTQGKLLKVVAGHSARVMSVAFAPNTRLLASGSSDLTVRLWNLRN